MNSKFLEYILLSYAMVDSQLQLMDDVHEITICDSILKYYYKAFKSILRIPFTIIDRKYHRLLNTKIYNDEFDIVLSNMDKYNCFIKSDDAKYVLYLYSHSELNKANSKPEKIFPEEQQSVVTIHDSLVGIILMIIHHFYSHLNDTQIDIIYDKIQINMIYVIFDSVKQIKLKRITSSN